MLSELIKPFFTQKKQQWKTTTVNLIKSQVYQSAAQMPKEPSVRKLLSAQACMGKYTLLYIAFYFGELN